MERNRDESDVFRFILEEIDSVPELEALLLLWQSRPSSWTVEDLAKRLYISPGAAGNLLLSLARRHLIATVRGAADSYGYESKTEEQDRLMERLDATYRREIVRISTLIHSKPSAAVRDFAKAFRFTKEKD